MTRLAPVTAIVRRASAMVRLSGADRRIAHGALTVGVFVLAAKAASAVRDVAIAWRYGVGDIVDAFQISFALVSWLPMILWSIGASVFVPQLVAARDPAVKGGLIRAMTMVFGATGIVVCITTAAAGPMMLNWLGGGMSAHARSLAAWMVVMMSPYAFFVVLAAAFAARLQAREQFAYAFWEAAPFLGVAILVGAWAVDLTSVPLVIGIVAGASVQAVVTGTIAHRLDCPALRVPPAPLRRSMRLRLASALGLMAGGQVVMALSIPVDQLFAAGLGTGALSQLGYATRLVNLGTGLGVVILARALLPVLSGLALAGESAAGQRVVVKWMGLMFATGAAAAALGAALAARVVRLIFQHGAFSVSDTQAVSLLTQFGLLQLPVFLAGMVLVQWFVARQLYGILLTAAIVGLGTKVLTNFILTPRLGLLGIIFGSVAMYAASWLVLAVQLVREWRRDAVQTA